MDLFAMATMGIKLIEQGKTLVNTVGSAVRDGKGALTTEQRSEILAMLPKELEESRKAHANLAAALKGE